MIVCHCQNITDHQIRAAVDWMRAADPLTVITPGKVYRALGKRPDCGSCMPLFLQNMRGCEGFRIAAPHATLPGEGAAARGGIPNLRNWERLEHEG